MEEVIRKQKFNAHPKKAALKYHKAGQIFRIHWVHRRECNKYQEKAPQKGLVKEVVIKIKIIFPTQRKQQKGEVVNGLYFTTEAEWYQVQSFLQVIVAYSILRTVCFKEMQLLFFSNNKRIKKLAIDCYLLLLIANLSVLY